MVRVLWCIIVSRAECYDIMYVEKLVLCFGKNLCILEGTKSFRKLLLALLFVIGFVPSNDTVRRMGVKSS